MSTKDKITIGALILIIILSIFWIINILMGAPIARQIVDGVSTIQSGIPANEKRMIDQK